MPPSGDRSGAILPKALVKRGVIRVEVLGVKMLLSPTKGVAKPLVMYYFSLAQILYGVAHVGVVNKTENVIISCSCLLLCCHIFMKVCYYIAL